ncbi:hypothetical protein B0H14DRAFT_2590879 [Mycena olivaceomarginata]|nr:hypothetical protein B0H14DRAFT_2590879 [Mycena olivaceomarginata]
MFKQYLQNTNDKFNRDLRVEKAAEAQGPPAPSHRSRAHSEAQPEQCDQEGEDEEADPDINIDMEVDDTASNQEEEDHFSQYDVDFPELADDSQMEEDPRLEAASWDGDGIVEEPEAVPAAAKRRKQAEKENAPPSTPLQPSCVILKPAVQVIVFISFQTTPPPAKRKYQEETTSVQQSKKVRFLQLKIASLSSPVIPPPSKPALVIVASPAAPLPSICPSSYCNDTLPANPSDELLALFARKQEILKGSKPGSTYDLTRQICMVIKSDNRRYACVQEAQLNGWVFNIDLDGLPARVLELQDQLLDLICDDRALDECPIWRNFLEQISYKVHAFSLAESGSFAPAADRAARCGYYGPTGKALIASTLYDYINKATSWIQIHNTIVTLTDTPQQWNHPGRHGTLLSAEQFVDYILAPFVTTTLIAEDLSLNFDDALAVLLKSSDYGDLCNTDILIRRPPLASNSKPLKPPMSLVNIKSKKQPTLADSYTPIPEETQFERLPSGKYAACLGVMQSDNTLQPQIKKKFSEPTWKEKPATTAMKCKKTKNTAPTEPVRRSTRTKH